jgi:hypothetical protein
MQHIAVRQNSIFNIKQMATFSTDDIFKAKFRNFESKPDAGEWESLNAKLTKVNFFKFNISSFNIYYATLILSLTIVGSVFFFSENTAKNASVIKEKEFKTIVMPKVPDKNNTINNSNNRTFTNEKDKSKKTMLSSRHIADSVIKPKDTVAMAQINTKNANDSLPVRKVVKVVRKTVVIKPDPIIKRDTVKI